MPYGFRVVRALCVGAILFLVSAFLLWPLDPVSYGISDLMAERFHFSGIFIYCLSLIILSIFVQPIWGLGSAILRRITLLFPQTKSGRITFGIIFNVLLLPLVILCIGSAIGLLGNAANFFENSTLSVGGKAQHFAWSLLVYAISLVPVFLGFLPVALVYNFELLKSRPILRQWFLQGRGGMARFAGPKTFDTLYDYEIGANLPTDQKTTKIYFGRTLFSDDFIGRDIAIKDDGHILTIGQPGSGKSVTAIWPNLALHAGSMVVIDPKGEHARMFTGQHQGRNNFDTAREELRSYQKSSMHRMVETQEQFIRGLGTETRGLTKISSVHQGKVFILDPFGCNGVYPSAFYNPLTEINIECDSARKLISAISGSCIVSSKGDNRFWEESARAVLDGVIAHVLSSYPKEKQSLPLVADLLIGNDPETGFADPQKFDDLLIDMRMNNAAGGLPKIGASTLDDLGDRARGSVIAELRTAMKWCTDPSMRTHLSQGDFTFQDVGRNPITVFISLPFGYMTEQMRWLRIVTEVSMRVLEDRENSRNQVLYILDELPQYGAHLKAIKEGMVTLRSAGVKLWAFVQNIKQLNECFGEDGAKNFQSGGTVQVFGVSDDETAQWVSKKLGKHRVPDRAGILRRKTVGMREEYLVPPEEVEQVLGKTSDIQYLFRSGTPPIRLRRMAYKSMTIEGKKFKGLPLKGTYDEH